MAIILTEELENGNTLHSMQMWWMPLTQTTLDILTDTFGAPDQEEPAPIWAHLRNTVVEYEQPADIEEAKENPEEFNNELYRTMGEALGSQVVIESVEALQADTPTDVEAEDDDQS